MNRTGLIVVLAIAAIVGVAFGLYPELDLMLSAPFNAMVLGGNNFAPHIYPPLMHARDIGLWVGTVLIAPAVAALLLKLILPRRKLLLSGRAILFLMATMALGPGLLVNVGLKDHWSRPRPIDVTQFGGDQHFVAWWIRAAIARATAHSSPAMCRARSGPWRRRRWPRRHGGRSLMARRSRSAPAWPRCA
jgi:lipid A 4'-phosphatase